MDEKEEILAGILACSMERARELLLEAGGSVEVAVDIGLVKGKKKNRSPAKQSSLTAFFSSPKRRRVISEDVEDVSSSPSPEVAEEVAKTVAERPVETELPYSCVAETLEQVFLERGRLKKAEILRNAWRRVFGSNGGVEAVVFARLLVGDVGEIGVGGGTVSQALSNVTGAGRDVLRKKYREMGDLGDVAASLGGRQRTLAPLARLSVSEVWNTLGRMAGARGSGATGQKQRLLEGLFRRAQGPELRFLVRTGLRNLRCGMSVTTVVECAAASLAHEGQEARDVERMRKCFDRCPDLDIVLPALARGGMDAVEEATIPGVGRPLRPMLAQPGSSAEGLLKEENVIAAEFKYDGQRAQIHVLRAAEAGDGFLPFETESGTVFVRVFSRHLEDSTARFSDAARTIANAIPKHITNCILDAEIVAVAPIPPKEDISIPPKQETPTKSSPDPPTSKKSEIAIPPYAVASILATKEKYRVRAFQELSTRPRGELGAAGSDVQVCVFCFDLMLCNGDSLLSRPLSERRKALEEMICISPGHVELAALAIPRSDAELTELLHVSIERGAEGLMVKNWGSIYEPGKRSSEWTKLKKDYVEGLADSLDLVPIGGWWGNGRKAGWVSPVLLGVYDPESGDYQSVCRCMSGFSDEFYKAMTQRLAGDRDALPQRKPSYIQTGESPPLWFPPSEVWEIRGADLSISPIHLAAVGTVHPDRGISLRFPRFVSIRDDKTPEDASTPEDIVRLFRQQAVRKE